MTDLDSAGASAASMRHAGDAQPAIPEIAERHAEATAAERAAADGTVVDRALVFASRLFHVFAGAGVVFAGAGVVFLALATTYDVTARYVFNSPTIWATEISTYVLVATIFLGAAHAYLIGAHVRVDVLLPRLSPRARKVALDTGTFVALLVAAIMAWQSWLLVVSDYRSGSRLLSLMITPAWMPKLPIAIGLTVLCGAILVDAAGRAERGRGLLLHAIFGLVLLPLLVVLGQRPPLIPGTRLDWGSLAVLVAVLGGAAATTGMRSLAALALLVAVGKIGLSAASTIGLDAQIAVIMLLIAVTLASGIRIAFALAFVGLCGIYFLTPIPFPATVAERTWNSVNSFALTAVPMYVLMGALLVHSGLSRELFAVMARLLARLPGGLAHAGVAGCAVFAAVSGSSVATAATMGSVACPEMTRRGYDPKLAYGSIAAGGTLGILIPPSVPLIIYGITVGVPVTTLFMAGIVPGILLVALFLGLIVLWSLVDRKAAPTLAPAERMPLSRASLIDTAIVVALVVLIILSLYGGVATPSEIGALGTVMAFLACLMRGRLSAGTLSSSIAETVVVTSFIFLIVIGANVLTYGFDYLKVSEKLMLLVTGAELNRWVVLAMILALYLVLGMFLDSISMLVLTLPVVFPLAQQLGFDAVWLGILLVIMAEVGLITPPVGMNLFILQGIGRDVSIREIALGALPFIGAMMTLVVLLSVFPEIALWLTR
ncbi:TRAP transporter large permease subunit [Neoaquamicrobium sediminum]|uniref:TRAP transporter large permease subunit n=1 Tax=Neoaquamicrobium sediminum TaxID=1849104 RepID=UPI003BAC92B7